MEYKYDVVAYIGRFQPYHVGHKSLVDHALTLAKQVVIVVGSAKAARSPKNPFTADERIHMIRAAHGADSSRIQCVSQEDYLYNYDRWLAAVTSKISEAAHRVSSGGATGWSDGKVRIGLIGFDKDASSFYLRSFPQWDSITGPSDIPIHATDIRRALFNVADPQDFEAAMALIPDGTSTWLRQFRDANAQAYYIVAREWDAMVQYHKQWESSPYPPTFLTADAVVTQDAHVLMVTRAAYPGYGLLALPGGFVNPLETIQDAAIRELMEETSIKVPRAVLRGSIVSSRVFDAPFRSLRGRTVTQAFHIKLNEKGLPKVRGGDDAGIARWVPLGSLQSDQCFEDHFEIIREMTGAL